MNGISLGLIPTNRARYSKCEFIFCIDLMKISRELGCIYPLLGRYKCH